MRFTAIICEAYRNVFSGAARVLVLLSVSVPLLTLLAVGSAMQAGRLLETAHDFLEGGGATFVTTATGAIDGSACNALTSRTDIAAAGALKFLPQLTIANLPDLPVNYDEVTVGLATALGIPRPLHLPAIAVESSLARDIGARPGTIMETNRGSMAVDSIYSFSNSVQQNNLNYTVLRIQQLRSPYDQCWTRIWPFNASASNDGLASTLPAVTGQQISTTQLNPSDGTTDPLAVYEARVGRYVPAVLFACIFALTYGVTRLRRLELSSARHFGMSRSGVATQLMVEALLWVLPAATFAFAACAVTIWDYYYQYRQVLLVDSAWGLAAGVSGAILAALLGGLCVTEGALLQYFKTRS